MPFYEVVALGKISFDDFFSLLKTEREEIEIEIIRSIAVHKSGMHHSNAHEYIENLLKENDRDRDIIKSKLTLLSNEKKYIYLDDEIYKFKYEEYDLNNIPFAQENPIKYYGVALGAKARDSKKEVMEKTESCVYLFMADTSTLYFKELINYRINKQYKTVVLFPHEVCFARNERKTYKKNLDGWKDYLQEGRVNNYLDFYLIKNKKYKYLYSSCLTKDIVRFDYYAYSDNNEINTGYGIIQAGEAGTSFYDIVNQGYECAFYEGIPVSVAEWNGKFIRNKIGNISSFFRRHLVKIVISTLICGAIAAYIILELIGSTSTSTVSSIFVLFTMVIGFLQYRINNLLTKKKLQFDQDE